MSNLRELLLSLGRDLFSFTAKVRSDPNSSRIVGYHSGDTSRIADREIESFIARYLADNNLPVKMVTEESGIIDPGNSEYLAVVDPLDGSSNFVMGIPWYSVSIAMYEADATSMRESKAGLVMNLVTGRTYSYDERMAYVEDNPQIDNPNTVLAYYDKEQVEDAMKVLERVKKPFKIRTLGSASLDMSLVCEGRASLYFDLRSKLRNVDIAASTNFCLKRGYSVVDEKGREVNPSVRNVTKIDGWVLVMKE